MMAKALKKLLTWIFYGSYIFDSFQPLCMLPQQPLLV